MLLIQDVKILTGEGYLSRYESINRAMSFDVPRGILPPAFYDCMLQYLQWAGLSRETHFHCGANSGSKFERYDAQLQICVIKFEPSKREWVFIHRVQLEYLDGLAAIGDVFV